MGKQDLISKCRATPPWIIQSGGTSDECPHSGSLSGVQTGQAQALQSRNACARLVRE